MPENSFSMRNNKTIGNVNTDDVDIFVYSQREQSYHIEDSTDLSSNNISRQSRSSFTSFMSENSRSSDHDHLSSSSNLSHKFLHGSYNSLRLFVGDKIHVENCIGEITSIGPRPNRKGLYVRVQLETSDNDNINDQSSHILSKHSRTIWIPQSSVERVIENSNRYQFTVGDQVSLHKKGVTGIIRYVGPTHFQKGVWFGIELNQPKGNNNGIVKKQFYFPANPNYGIFVHHKNLTLIRSPDKKIKRNDNEIKSSKSLLQISSDKLLKN